MVRMEQSALSYSPVLTTQALTGVLRLYGLQIPASVCARASKGD